MTCETHGTDECVCRGTRYWMDRAIASEGKLDAVTSTAVQYEQENERLERRLDRVRRVIADNDMWPEGKYIAICSVLEEHAALAELGICGKCGKSIDGPPPCGCVVEKPSPIAERELGCAHRWTPRAGNMGDQYCSRCGLVIDEDDVPTGEMEKV